MIEDRVKCKEAKSECSKSLEYVILTSEYFMKTNVSNINYNDINNQILQISGAKYSGFNIYNSDGTEYTTVSMGGVSENILKATKMIGFELLGKTWKHDPVRANMISSNTITHFDSLSALTGKSISPIIINSIQKAFSLGSVIVAKIQFENIMLGDFTLIFTKGDTVCNKQILELYLHQCGLFLSRLKYEKELFELNTRKETLLSIVSHDLRGPIGSFKNLIDFILEDKSNFNENEIINIMNEMSKATASIYDLLDNLLNWVKINKNKNALIINEINIKSVIEIVHENLRIQLEAKDIILKNNLKDTILITADKDSLIIVVRNIIANAIKFSKPNSIIEVYTKSLGSSIELYIEDHGIGMPKVVLEKIKTNARITNLGTKQEKGSGLGLILCNELILLNNAQMIITSKLDKGTIVKLIFCTRSL